MNIFKKTLISEIEATKQNKTLVIVASVLALPVLLDPLYEAYFREEIADQEKADQIGRALTAASMIGGVVSLIPSIMYQVRRHKIYKSL